MIPAELAGLAVSVSTPVDEYSVHYVKGARGSEIWLAVFSRKRGLYCCDSATHPHVTENKNITDAFETFDVLISETKKGLELTISPGSAEKKLKVELTKVPANEERERTSRMLSSLTDSLRSALSKDPATDAARPVPPVSQHRVQDDASRSIVNPRVRKRKKATGVNYDD